MIDPSFIPFILIGGGIIFLFIFFHYVPFFLWLSAKVSGVDISLVQLFLMRIRNVPPHIIVPAMIEAHKAGLSNITRDELEAHYMAGGHVERVVHALVSASKANIELTFQMKDKMPKPLAKKEVRNIFDLTTDDIWEIITKSRGLWAQLL